MATAFGAGLSSALVKESVMSIFGNIKQQVLYVFKHNRYINDLNDRVQELNHKRERVELGVDHARRQGDEIYEDVDKWLKDVKQFIEQEANPITRNEAQAETCSLITRYKVGRRAVKAAKAGSSLLGKDFSDVSYRPALQRTESMYVDRDYEPFDSRESILSEIMEVLKDASVNRIGVYGMGGVGKTTLIKKVAWKAKEEKLFDDVVMAEVSEKPDHKKIQETIAFDLDLQFGQHENELVRAHRIRTRLKKGKRVLVILDNIWAKLDLGAIGIPLGNDHDKGITTRDEEGCEGINDNQRVYKILVTSRRLDVLCNYMSTGKNFCVQTLSQEEAQNLFSKIAGSGEITDFCVVAEEIVEKCGGLPLAIITIASALKNKDLYCWEDALGKLKASNPKGIPEMYKDVFSVIELSFNLLGSDEAKSLFLLIGLVHNSYGISHDYLLRYGMGLGLFKDVYTLEQGRKRVAALDNDLKASCLLLEDHTLPWARMHEIVLSVAVSIASTDKLWFNVQGVLDLNRALQEKISPNATAISLPWRDICQLPERLESPKLELLLLFTKSHSLKIPNNFFEGVKELKVINMGYINLMSTPSSFGYLTNLRTLCLDECLLGDVSIIGELTNLQILSFSLSNIEHLPREIGQLTRLQLLDLSSCSSLKVIPANVISRLSQLEELDLDNSFVQWEDGLNNRDGCNANLTELNQLSHLTTLRICIPDAQIIPPSLFIQQLKRFKILIGDVWAWSYSIEVSRMLKVKLNNISYLGYKLIKRLLKITEDLFLDELNDVQDFLYELDEEGFLNLKYLHVQNGPKLLYIVNSVGRIPYDAFLMLEALSLNNLVNLVKICHGPLKEASFNKLKVVKVNKCDELKHLFSISMAKYLSQLMEIEVTNCKNLQVIFVEEADKGYLHDESETNNKIEFGQLRSLTLKVLPQFMSFSLNVIKTSLVSQTEIIAEDDVEDFKTLFGTRVELSSLESLTLSSINIEKISSVGTYCCTLKSLVLEGCSGMKFSFSSSMVKSLMQLQNLKICKCESMEEVIDTNELKGEGTINFPKLLTLCLKDLSNLTRFGIGTSIEFPLLHDLVIDNCPNLRTFLSNSISGTARNEHEEMNSKENIQALFGEKVRLPGLAKLFVTKVYNLRKIWDDHLSSDSFCKLHSFLLLGCSKLLNVFPSSMLGRLHALHHFGVGGCDSLEEIFEFQAISGQNTPAVMATQLSVLFLDNLPKLKHVWNTNAREIPAFENLTTVRVSYCFLLKSLFPASIAQGLLKLEELEIRECCMDEIVAKEERVVEAAINIPPRFKFPRLSSVEFTAMPDLKAFYPERHISEWPALKKIKVCNCSNIKILSSELQSQQQRESQLDHRQTLFLVDKVAFPNLEELEVSSMDTLLHLWAGNSQPSGVFQNLEKLKLSKCRNLKNLGPSTMSLCNLQTLEVSECDKLMNLVTVSTSRSLVQVTRMDIADCKMIEGIITKEGDEATNYDDRIVFNQLKYLRLCALPNLTSFWSENYGIEFPELEQVIIGKCTKMEMFCPGVVWTPKLYKVFSTGEDDDQGHWQDNLNNTIQLFFKELVGFRGIESLKLSEFPQLKEIWHNQLPFNVFCNLKSLEVDECAHLSCAISSNLLLFLNNLKDLCLRNCDSVEEVFDLEKINDDGHLDVLSQLSQFHLINLPRLKKLSRSNQEILSFQNLQFLEVQDCGNLRYIFPVSVIFGLKHLQEMKISNCVTMEIIIIDETDKDAADEIVIPMLKSMILEFLPALRSFYSGNNIAECPSLNSEAKVDVGDTSGNFKTLLSKKVGCPRLESLKLSSISIEKLWPEQISSIAAYCRTIEHLTLEGCNGLEFLFSSSMVKNFMQLQDLKICGCEFMEEIIDTKGLREEETISFPKLCFLELKDLPKLKRFGMGKSVEFPSLNQLQICNCPNLMTLFCNCTCEIRRNEMNSEQNIKPLFSEKVSVPNLEKLEVCKMDNLRKIWDDQLTLDSFSKLKDLKIEDCSELKNIFPSIMLGRLQTLCSFIVSNCESLEEIFEVQALGFERTDAIVVGQLKEIHLSKLPKLKHAWNLAAQAVLSFKNLHSLKVQNCDNLKFLFPTSIATGLLQLKELEITSCMVEGIVAKEELAIDTIPKFVFPQLTSLLLKELPVLKSFYTGMHTLEWPVLTELEIYKCDIVKIFASEFQNYGEGQHDIPIQQNLFWVDKIVSPALEKISLCFQHVTEMRLDGCDNLKYLFTASMVASLVQLELLHISNCNFMEGVIFIEKERISEKLFPKLWQLELLHLPKLKRFCNFTRDLIELFSLNVLMINNCPKMEAFVSNSICADITRDEPEEMNSEDNLHTYTQSLFDEKVSLPNLQSLIVANINLRKIWDDDQLGLDSFNNLRQLGVRDCNQLLHIFPSIMLGRLQRIKLLVVRNCNSLEEIIELQALVGQDEIVFEELACLELVRLPELRSFCLGSCTLKFPFLDKVTVTECSKMETFSQGILCTPKLQRLQLTEEEDEGRWDKDLNTTIQHMFKEMNAQTSEQD